MLLSDFKFISRKVIGITADLMHRHDVTCIEEPPAERLQEMLQGDLLIDDYLWPAEVEYPECSRRMCRLLHKLYQNGKEIIHVEPILENLPYLLKPV